MINYVIDLMKECRPIFIERDFTVDNKTSPSDYVTSADLKIESFLKQKLLELLPEAYFLGEESKEYTDKYDYLWIVDPIDGTSNFVRNLNYSCISVALVYKNSPILGVIYNPYTDEAFFAEKGKGAFLNGERIHTSNRPFEQSILCTAMSLYEKRFAKNCFNIIERVYTECDDIRRMGSAALELASLAAGRTELYFEIRVQPWDFAAGELIIKEAGGYVGTIGYDSPIYNRPIPLICANTEENYKKLFHIVKNEIPTIPYDN